MSAAIPGPIEANQSYWDSSAFAATLEERYGSDPNFSRASRDMGFISPKGLRLLYEGKRRPSTDTRGRLLAFFRKPWDAWTKHNRDNCPRDIDS